MPTPYVLDTNKVIPLNKAGPVVGIGCKALVRRGTAGAVTIEILRGDGGFTETYPYSLRSRAFTLEAGVPLQIELATRDLSLPDFTPRGYRMRIVGDGSEIGVDLAHIATEPYGPPP